MSKQAKNRRWRMIADPKIQGLMCVRVAIYWVICHITVLATIMALSSLQNGTGSASDFFLQTAIVSGLTLPIVLFDLVCFSNRFVGPIHNLRKRMRELVDTGETTDFRFRDGDYYIDLSENFNDLRHRIAEQESRAQDTEHQYAAAGELVSQ